MERDDHQPCNENACVIPRGPNVQIVFIGPTPGIEIEDVVNGLLRPLRQGEWRFVFIPNNMLVDVVRELRTFLALESLRDSIVRLAFDD
ncbi:uncharacterized protein FOMMEDRAFT_166975 [Fomitiporia mediterranea MF3/22]|uniref:uncharacterized protein n=1 Tax=Fomitiporia mediterranea (strain MF3/22) TaxID=694068 RepID=UPI0004408D35|nr:uncharacterized protein FOMMEDRAFT_166975 [Fomitiporia mediterranea MF3/22]EJD03622.1 hypothetical protein FOMMEDRAFT_166975 [Fomitiporia mediterranea MF3/22]